MAKQEKVVASTDLDAKPICCCNCKRKIDPYQLFEDNIEDVAKCLAQIMVICGINTTKACNAKSIIKRAFIYHEKLRTRCPASPPVGTHLHRDDMLQALRIKCEMESVEAMLTYAIIKRAFKAFFHGKPPRTISNPIQDAMVIHTQKSAWLHAAYRTARIFDNYKAAFFWAHKAYEKQITIVYRSLYERMSARANPLTVPTCSCRKCGNMEVPGYPKPGAKVHEKFKLADCKDLPLSCILCGLQVPKIETDVKVKRPRPIINHELKLPRCTKCNSPMLICECNIDQLTGELYGECGQDSYKVKWYRLEEDKKSATSFEDAQEPGTDWENHHCPIDCKHSVCSETSNVCHEDRKTSVSTAESSSSFTTCSGSEDPVEKLEQYLNQLWNEEIAAKNNPHTYKPRVVFPPRESCQACHRD
ncbi:PREDICTED: uncharacterized protein LOC108614172 [Drosophila arizonae]|uniref:Uncharacterized protein LOC108614172 n=1 Tax=Drosophila arizonae TaxID=7263 RepID=A0ABM1P8U5_DROAR|nr:PREDICTED: uncharacterized protein LOC108614172 [Drosophila arizonae]